MKKCDRPTANKEMPEPGKYFHWQCFKKIQDCLVLLTNGHII